MDLIPITQMFIDKEKWLSKKIKYEEDIYYNDIINDINEMIINWILKQDDLEIITDSESIKNDLIKILLPFVKK